MIHQEGSSIAKASKVTGIPYVNAKAINRTYLREKRVHKLNYRKRYQKKTLSSSSLLSIPLENDESKGENSIIRIERVSREDEQKNEACDCAESDSRGEE